MLNEYYEKFIRSIEKDDLIGILKLMMSKGVAVNGFTKLEKVPLGMLINSVIKKETIRTIFFESSKEYYENKTNKDDFLKIIEGFENGGDESKVADLISSIDKQNELEQKDIICEQNIDDESLHCEEQNMYTFLGYMDVQTTRDYSNKIYNFYPLYEKIDGNFIKIEQPKERFQEYGNFAIFLSDKNNYYLSDNFVKGEYCIIELSDDDIHENTNFDGSYKTSHKKIYIDTLDKLGKVHKLSDYKLYPIVEPLSYDLDLSKGGPIELNDSFPINRFCKRALLNFNGYYYGPFEITLRIQDERMILLNNTNKQGYICNRYTVVNNDKEVLLYCDPQSYGVSNIDILPLEDENIKEEVEDFLDGNALLEDYNNFINNPENSSKSKNLYFSKIGNDKIASSRFERLKNILSKQEEYASYENELSQLLENYIINNSDKDGVKGMLENLVNDKTFINKIPNVTMINGKIEKIKEELVQKETELKELEAKKESLKQESIDSISNEIKQKEEEKNKLVEQINSYDEDFRKLELAKSTEKLQSEYDSALQSWGRLRSQIDEKTSTIKDSLAQIIFNEQFDKIVYDRMATAISNFEYSNENEKFKEISDNISRCNLNELQGEELIEFIVREVKKFRPGYSRNSIINILICVSQNLLTVFSGKPGTGKTSICKIISHVLGLDNPLNTKNNIGKRFINVHVERGWNSKRDLIGYYNPLSRKIEKNNIELYNAFKILDTEAKTGNSFLPMFVLLDEANLSPMEFYWADFVGICDDFMFANNTINLGDTEQLIIPNTLRFLATINNDHTTETLSPRLIDRSFIITLNNQSTSDDTDNFNDQDYKPVKLSNLLSAIDCNVGMSKEQIDLYTHFENSFKKVHEELSPRLKNSVEKYCSSANGLFESENNIDGSTIALDYALSQKVITKIKGSNDKYLEVLKELSDYCNENWLFLTKEHIDRIIDNSEMQYYQFFD